jgi:tight adherence protein B
MTALVTVIGAAIGLGVFLVVFGLRTVEPVALRPRTHTTNRRLVRIAGGVGAGVLIGAAILAAAAGAALPTVISSRASQAAATARIEALASWTEMLRDTMAGAAGIQGAILATAEVSPLAIRAQVVDLASRLHHERLSTALRAFAEDLADPTADLVVAALILASEYQARRLGELLGSLATTARDHVTMRLRVEAGRARTRTSVRVVIGATVVMSLGLIILNRGYLTPYNTPLGQLMLVVIGGCFAGAFVWLTRMSAIATPQRFLVAAADGGAQ